MQQAETIKWLKGELAGFVAARPQRSAVRPIWREPLLVTATADDRFLALRDMVAHDHMLPGDLLSNAKSVVVFFVPFIPGLAKENAPGKIPSRSWGEAYVSTNSLIEAACAYLISLLEAKGFACEATPATHNFDEQRLISRWSHKHLAHICGLGRFGRHYQLITPKGACGRLGSFVTSAELGDNPLVHQGVELCLHKQGKECLACVKACPMNALTEDSFDRQRCWDRLNFIRNKMELYRNLPESTHVCAKCQVDMPCSHTAPK
jgi:epoxyqueuosine reductase